MADDLRDRVSRLEGRMESVEHRTDTNTRDIMSHDKDIASIRDDLKDVNRFLDKATGAFNGARWAFIALGFLISIGILSVTFGG